jgi:hypothetical protein
VGFRYRGAGIGAAPAIRMPKVSEFFGIAVYMYFAEHVPPHFHAWYGKHEVLVRIDTLEPLRGCLPRRALALVLEWAALHRAELQDDWDRARNREALAPIPPLD